MTKKVKKETQADAKVTTELQKDVKMPTLEEIQNCEVGLASDDSFDGGSDLMKKDTFGLNVAQGREGELARPDSLKEYPLVTIAGEMIELKEIDPPMDPYCSPMGITLSSERGYTAIYGQREANNVAKMKWFGFKLGGVEFLISSGSSLVVAESLNNHGCWYDEGEGEITGPTKLILCGASIETRNLVLRGYNSLNNSYITTPQYVELKKAILTTSCVSSDSNVTLTSSVLTDTSILGNNTQYINLTKTKLEEARIGGFNRINLIDVDSYRSAKFSLNGWSRHGVTAPSLEIKNTRLVSFEGQFSNLGDNLSKWEDISNSWTEPCINIGKGIDYGYFSGLTTIPFVKIGKFDILVGGEVFMASEFFPVDKGEAYPTPSKQPQEVSLGGGYGPYNNNFGIGVLNTGAHYRGTMLWNRAAKAIFGFKYGKQPIGKNGEAIVNALIEQIKSRIGIYVELTNLTTM
ncbi:hypothetical protein YUBABA_00680 [Serratia phage vB_SmaM-Yubaba]|nr:hypothetical protein SUREIYA_01710 [Serratia phage vB_SmaM-Sureiya]UQT03274.1 hypothetical protein YUBABA_00680 [Serratia phage vB_SmaM-Yubaba]